MVVNAKRAEQVERFGLVFFSLHPEQDAASFFPYHVVCHVTSGIVRLAFGQEHFFALQRLTEEVLVLAQV